MEIEDDFIDCKCPACSGPVSFPADSVGRIEKCPNCMEDLVVPGDGREIAGQIPLPISTPRLILRRLTMADWKDLLEYHSDEALHEYLSSLPMEEKEILQWLEDNQHVKLTTPDQTFPLAIELRSEGRVIGDAALRFTDSTRMQLEFVMFVSRKYQRQGFATEALKAILGFCFQGIGLHRVSCRCDSRNVAACRLAARAGLRHEGHLIKDRCPSGEWVDSMLYALLEEEYVPDTTSPG